MKQTAWLDNNVLKAMAREADFCTPRETGGILMGYWAGIDQVVITNIIGPGPKAVHRSYSFTPDDDWQTKEIGRIYTESGRVVTYLGEWHSHPHGAPGLSFKDLRTLFRVAVHKPARAPRPIMGILYNNPSWELVMWRFAFSKIVSGMPAAAMKVIWFDSPGDLVNNKN
jgi:integrative and conjugative element protein (TIGR02256 family)